jgi:hypothetical protein
VSADVLRWPVVGRFLRWRHARTAAQLALLLVAAAVVFHGLFGPQVAPANLATVLTWVHYRGLLIVAVLASANLFCMGCPMVLVRDAARRVHSPHRSWPRRLRNKWAALVLFAGVLFVYELFDLWALPRATAMLVLGYFAAAVAIDVVFTGATFCKYLCPVGQFNFVAATMAPLEVRARDQGVCRSCRTFDCIAGSPTGSQAGQPRQRGCELRLFLPLKRGSMDCTLCLDCVHACPHDNAALSLRVPGLELVDAGRRSGVGRLPERRDIAALAVLFVSGALVNAFAMTDPARRVESWVAESLRTSSEGLVLAVMFLFGLVIAPVLVVAVAAAVTRRVSLHDLPLEGGSHRNVGSGNIADVATRFAYALIPLGACVWLAHYGFHLLTGLFTVVPVAQTAAIDAVGWAALGEPAWRWVGLQPGTVFPLQLGFIVLGAMGSVAIASRIASRDYSGRPGAAAAPWIVLVVVLTAVAMWLIAQPMALRGASFAV